MRTVAFQMDGSPVVLLTGKLRGLFRGIGTHGRTAASEVGFRGQRIRAQGGDRVPKTDIFGTYLISGFHTPGPDGELFGREAKPFPQ